MRFYYLQFARFFAASAVVLFHKYKADNLYLSFLISKGDFAVSFFFILSGFVISFSLIRKKPNFKTYLFRRVLKIIPQWILSIILSLLVAGTMYISPMRLILAILLLQTIYPDYAFDINFVGWSLSVELIMYLVLYLVITQVNIHARKFEILIWGVWLFTQVIFLYLLSLKIQPNTFTFNWNFFLFYHPIWHLNSFMLGILFSIYFIRFSDFTTIKLKYSVVILILIYFFSLFSSFYIGYKLNYNGFYHNGFMAPLTGCFIFILCNIESTHKSQGYSYQGINHIMDMLGSISFGIYLFHIPLYNLLDKFFEIGSNGINFWGYYIFVLFFSYLAYLLLDKTLHRLLIDT